MKLSLGGKYPQEYANLGRKSGSTQRCENWSSTSRAPYALQFGLLITVPVGTLLLWGQIISCSNSSRLNNCPLEPSFPSNSVLAAAQATPRFCELHLVCLTSSIWSLGIEFLWNRRLHWSGTFEDRATIPALPRQPSPSTAFAGSLKPSVSFWKILFNHSTVQIVRTRGRVASEIP